MQYCVYTIWHNESFGEFYPVYNGKKSDRNSQGTDTVYGRLGVESAIERQVTQWVGNIGFCCFGNAMGW